MSTPGRQDTPAGHGEQLHVGWQMRDQARWCAEMGSPLYADLLLHAAVDVENGGPTWRLLREHVAPGRGEALALRLMAAVHRLVLTGRAPRLAPHYPSAGGDPGLEGAWAAFRDVLDVQASVLQPLILLPCQTNEVGRCAALVFGFLEVAASGLPLRVLEVGASAGLNLRFDHFSYGGGGAAWGDRRSPVDLTGLWRDPPRHIDAAVEVVERRGCDLRPLDPTLGETRLALESSVWADQVGRFTRLRGALELAARVPVTLDAESLGDWVPRQLAERRRGVATVVYHSIVEEYLPEHVRRGFHDALAEAGARASEDATLAWLRLEPIPPTRRHGVRLTTWPGGHERLLARCGAHGTNVQRL